MSQLLNAVARGGDVKTFDGVLAPAFIDQGIPYQSAGVVGVDSVGAIDHYYQGLPFTAVGNLAAAVDAIVDHISPGGAPFTAAGRLVFGVAPVDHIAAGIPYTATNQLKTQ